MYLRLLSWRDCSGRCAHCVADDLWCNQQPKPKIQHAARIPAMPMLYTPILGHCFLSDSHISLVLFWRIKKSSSIYHVLSYIWNKWNSIRVFAIKVAQHRIPEWKTRDSFVVSWRLQIFQTFLSYLLYGTFRIRHSLLELMNCNE